MLHSSKQHVISQVFHFSKRVQHVATACIKWLKEAFYEKMQSYKTTNFTDLLAQTETGK